MKYIVTIILTAAVCYGIFMLRDKQLNCKLLNSTETLVVSDDAFQTSKFRKGDTLSVVSFRNLRNGYRSDWQVNTGYSQGDTVYLETRDQMLVAHYEPIRIADELRTVVVQ